MLRSEERLQRVKRVGSKENCTKNVELRIIQPKPTGETRLQLRGAGGYNGISQLKRGVNACACACSFVHYHPEGLSLGELQKTGLRDPLYPFYHSPG